MNTVSKMHLTNAQQELRKALGYSAPEDDSNVLRQMTEMLSTLDSWCDSTDIDIADPKPVFKSELNNTPYRWKNEYTFVPASGQIKDEVVQLEDDSNSDKTLWK